MAEQELVEIEIDGKKLQVKPGSMIIEAADDADIKIPRFCYHKKLSIAANCRMCLVDVEKANKPLPACATPIMPGMVVRTQSKEALVAQRAVMEFLLINHPLDCPICDQGGECELQDVAMGYGKSVSRYTEGKRSVKDKDIGSLVATDMTRCILCTRCVRFGQEVIGLPELGATGRGEHTEIGTYIEKSLTSEMSGNIIDLCPVGALTSKPFRFKARAWELEQGTSVAPHDCVGSNIYVHRHRDKVMRVVPKDDESINECWISDRDRFSYEGLYHEDRLTQPMIKKEGAWQVVDWQEALTFAVDGLKKVIDDNTAAQLAAVASPNSTVEEHYLLQKLVRGLGSHNIDHRLRQTDFSDQLATPVSAGLPISIEAIETQEQILLIGSDVQREQPIVGHRIRRAYLRGTNVCVINPMDYHFNFDVKEKIIVSPSTMLQELAAVTKAVLDQTQNTRHGKVADLLKQVTVSDSHQRMAKQLLGAGDKVVLLGAHGLNHLHSSQIKLLANTLSQAISGQCGYLTEGANATGASLAGAIPHRCAANLGVAKSGLDAKQIWQSQLKAFILLNLEPEYDCADPQMALASLQQANFVVSLSPYMTSTMKDYANVILPVCPFAETSGTFVNIENKWQSFAAAAAPQGEARPGWKVLRVLGNLFEQEGFDYTVSTEVRDELKVAVDGMTMTQTNQDHIPSTLNFSANVDLERIAYPPIYRTDNLVRRGESLQRSGIAEAAAVHLSANTATQMNLADCEQVTVKQNGQHVNLPLHVDGRVPDNCVYIPSGFAETAMLGVTSPAALTLERS